MILITCSIGFLGCKYRLFTYGAFCIVRRILRTFVHLFSHFYGFSNAIRYTAFTTRFLRWFFWYLRLLGFGGYFSFPLFNFLITKTTSNFVILSKTNRGTLSSIFSYRLHFTRKEVYGGYASGQQGRTQRPVFTPVGANTIASKGTEQREVQEPRDNEGKQLRTGGRGLCVCV